jgi:hypothetical protein
MTDRPTHRDDEPDTVGELLSGERLRSLLANEPGLWPVAIVLAVVAVTFGVALLTLAVRGHSPFAAGVIALLALMSIMLVDGSRRKHGRFRSTLWLVAGYWSIAAGATFCLLRWTGV